MTGPHVAGRRRLAWFHCFAGIAGDMALGALVDAGAPLDDVRAMLGRLDLPGWGIRAEAAVRGGIGATRLVVEVEDPAGERPFAALAAIVAAADLPGAVAERSMAALRAMAEAEAAVHRVPVDEVHLHELGGHDTLVDVVGTAAALHLLGVDDVACSPVVVGTGTVRSAHGPLPNPSPAVLALLRGAPVVGRDSAVECTTPTGAAMVAAWATTFGPLPAVTVTATGYGAGTADPPDLPNCVQVVVGDVVPAAEPGGGWPAAPESLVLLETTVDDVTGEVLAHTVEACLAAGALDAWVAPVVMKRGRPGHVLSALVRPVDEPAVRAVIGTETGTLGIRAARVDRWAAPRRFVDVEVGGLPVPVKVGPAGAKAEHAAAALAAERLGRPVRVVAAEAEEAWRRLDAPDP